MEIVFKYLVKPIVILEKALIVSYWIIYSVLLYLMLIWNREITPCNLENIYIAMSAGLIGFFGARFITNRFLLKRKYLKFFLCLIIVFTLSQLISYFIYFYIWYGIISGFPKLNHAFWIGYLGLTVIVLINMIFGFTIRMVYRK